MFHVANITNCRLTFSEKKDGEIMVSLAPLAGLDPLWPQHQYRGDLSLQECFHVIAS